MPKLLEWILTAAVAVIVPATIVALFNGVKWIAGIKKTVDEMKENGKKRSEETKTVVSAILTIADVQRTTLEAIRDGKCNGNISSALGKLEESGKEVKDMLLENVG